MKILFITAGIFHPPLLGRWHLQRCLSQGENFSSAHIASLNQLPENLDDFSALVLYYHHKNRSLTASALDTLTKYLSRGGGILAVHSATASYKDCPPYFEILGGRFVRHGAVQTFTVVPAADCSFEGIGEFTLRDELYYHELKPAIKLQYVAKTPQGDVPVVWSHLFGKGRVCYAMPGHLATTMKNPAYQKLLQQALEWVCRREAE